MTDGQLLAEFARTRAESAFAELVRRHGRMVHGACLRMTGSPELAEEAAQAAFLILARKAASLARKPDAGGWLHRTAGNVARWMKRSELRRRAHEREAAAVRQQQVDPAGQEAFAALAGSLDAELGRLSDGQRQVVVGLYLEGRTRADLTKALGVPEGTVAWRSKAAIEKLRERLSRRDVATLSLHHARRIHVRIVGGPGYPRRSAEFQGCYRRAIPRMRVGPRAVGLRRSEIG